MARQSIFYFYPERIGWIGALVLASASLLVIPYLFYAKPSFVGFHSQVEREQTVAPLEFSLGLSGKGPSFPIPDLQGEMTFSFDPPRPDGAVCGQRLLVRMRKSAESKRVTLPCRLDLEIQRGQLSFAKEKSSFWVELAPAVNGQIEGKGYITSLEEGKIDAGAFFVSVQECPVQDAHEFPDGSPFRALAEGRWWGRDLFRHQCEASSPAERIEIGSEMVELKESDWLVWKERGWQKSGTVEKDKVIAHIQSISSKALVLEGWDQEGYVRVSLSPAAGTPFKVKGEDLFSAIRIRSEKQISCMLEKQCMVLKTGDWVLKTNGRWKILRKKDEREAYLNGKLLGELFVFEQIHAKQGQKMIQGRLYNPGRTQTVAVEMAVQSKGLRKGKAQ